MGKSIPAVYSYIRFSTPEQARGNSSHRQLNFAREIANSYGVELDESLTMNDQGLSAYHQANIKRGALGVFLKAVEGGRVAPGSMLVIESLDRISRADPMDAQAVVTQIINAGITVVTAVDKKEYNREKIKQNPMDLIYIILILIRANEESETKSTRVTKALLTQCKAWESGERGFRIKTTKAPKWVKWCSEDKVFKLVPNEAQIMKRKIEHYRNGHGGMKIAELINNEFGDKTVHHTGANVYAEVLKPSLIGELHLSIDGLDFVLRDYYPPLITRADFNKMISDSKKRGAVKHRQKFVSILSGIDVFKCSSCGQGISSNILYRGKKIEELPPGNKRYLCFNAKRSLKQRCKMSKTVQLDAVEKAVIKYCQDHVNLKRILLASDQVENIEQERAELEERSSKTTEKIEKLMDTILLLGDESPLVLAKKIKELEIEQSEIEDTLQNLELKQTRTESTHKDRVTDRWQRITSGIVNLGNDDRHQIRLLVKDTFKDIFLNTDPENHESASLVAQVEKQLLGINTSDCFDLTMVFHNGVKRIIRAHKFTGELIEGVEF